SIVLLFSRGRWPPTDGPEPAPIPPELATPAPSRARFNTPPVELDAIGKSDDSREEYVVVIWPVVVSSGTTASVTSIAVETSPTVSVKPAVAVLLRSTPKSLSDPGANPCAVAVMV